MADSRPRQVTHNGGRGAARRATGRGAPVSLPQPCIAQLDVQAGEMDPSASLRLGPAAPPCRRRGKGRSPAALCFVPGDLPRFGPLAPRSAAECQGGQPAPAQAAARAERLRFPPFCLPSPLPLLASPFAALLSLFLPPSLGVLSLTAAGPSLPAAARCRTLMYRTMAPHPETPGAQEHACP